MDLRLASRNSNTYCIDTKFIYISKFLLNLAPHPPHPPRLLQGICPPCQSLGGALATFALYQGQTFANKLLLP